jgi:hypothetical protein
VPNAPADVGLIRPQHLWIPDRAGSYGDEVIDLWKLAGGELDPEQELAIDAAASHDEFGDWTAGEICIVEPRQNGKTSHVVVPLTLADLFLFPPGVIMHTAHRFKTTASTFGQLRQIIDGCYELRRRVKKILEGHGNEQITLTNGAELFVLARSMSGGRGFTGKRIDLDEAFALQEHQLDAIIPTLLAVPNTQIVYASSAGLEQSASLRALRDRGRAQNDPDLIYIEWCASGSWEEPGCEQKRCNHHYTSRGCALDNIENQRQANPAFGKRITSRSIRKMRKGLTPKGFGREVLGWWDAPPLADISPITIERWDKCADKDSQVVGPISIGFDVTPDRRSAAIAIAGHREDGIEHGEVIRHGEGTEWVVAEIRRLIATHEMMAITVGKERLPAVVCDPAGPAGTLIPDLAKVGIHAVTMTARSLGVACGGLQDAVTQGPLVWRHLGQPQVDLAIQGVTRRDIGDGAWAFGRSRSAAASVDICPLMALTVARWGMTVAAPAVREPRARWA